MTGAYLSIPETASTAREDGIDSAGDDIGSPGEGIGRPGGGIGSPGEGIDSTDGSDRCVVRVEFYKAQVLFASNQSCILAPLGDHPTLQSLKGSTTMWLCCSLSYDPFPCITYLSHVLHTWLFMFNPFGIIKAEGLKHK